MPFQSSISRSCLKVLNMLVFFACLSCVFCCSVILLWEGSRFLEDAVLQSYLSVNPNVLQQWAFYVLISNRQRKRHAAAVGCISVCKAQSNIMNRSFCTAASSRPSAKQFVTGRRVGSRTMTQPFGEKKIPRVALTSRFLAVRWGRPARRWWSCVGFWSDTGWYFLLHFLSWQIPKLFYVMQQDDNHLCNYLSHVFIWASLTNCGGLSA